MKTGETVHAHRATVHRQYDSAVEQYHRWKLNSVIAEN